MGWTFCRSVMIVIAGALVLSACAARKQEAGKELQEKLRKLAEHPGQALTESVDKQRMSPSAAPETAPGGFHMLLPHEPIWIESGKARALQLQNQVTRVSIADPDLAGIVVLGPRSIMINAKPLPKVEMQGQEAGVQVSRGVFLGRTLTAQPHMAETTLTIWGDSGVDVHTLTVADFVDQQVMLEVTVAEVDRTALEDHGIDFRVVQNDAIAASFFGAGSPIQQLTTVPPQIGRPLLPLTVGSDTPTYALIFPNEDITAFLRMLQTERLATVLAQPKLVAMSGQTAVFQVGGEIPIRISSGFAADIEFKPFGTIVNFVPRVSDEGDILLTVTPEVSEPDFTQSVEGIPSFITRRASTSMRMKPGQTMVIGGLLQTKTLEEVRGVPYLKDIPVLGYAFRITSYMKDVTELLVVVKPSLVRPIPAGEEVTLPTDRGPLTTEDVRTKSDPAETTRPRIPGLP